MVILVDKQTTLVEQQQNRGEVMITLIEKCPYSINGKCKACHVLSINCEGDKYIHCTQYQIEKCMDSKRKQWKN